MPILNWSSTILTYPAHARSAVPVIALSHMNTHEALRFAESIGLFTGWVITEQPQPLLQGLLEGKPSWVSLAEMFVERRIVKTEGMVSGSVIFTAAVPRWRSRRPLVNHLGGRARAPMGAGRR